LKEILSVLEASGVIEGNQLKKKTLMFSSGKSGVAKAVVQKALQKMICQYFHALPAAAHLGIKKTTL
jgi:hypothetical protein